MTAKINYEAIDGAFKKIGLDRADFYAHVDQLAQAYALKSVGTHIKDNRKVIDNVVFRFSELLPQQLQFLAEQHPLTTEVVAQNAAVFGSALMGLALEGDYPKARAVLAKDLLGLDNADYKFVQYTPTMAWRSLAEMFAMRALVEMGFLSQTVSEDFDLARALTGVRERYGDDAFRQELRGLFQKFPKAGL